MAFSNDIWVERELKSDGGRFGAIDWRGTEGNNHEFETPSGILLRMTTAPISVDSRHQPGQGRGVVLGIAAFGFWGLIPLYFKAVAVVPPMEVLAHRVVWSIVVLGLVVGWRRQWPEVLSAFSTWRNLRVLLVTTVLIATNWFVFIWAVANHRVLEASLGYFINPLVSVMLGVVFLGERLRRLSQLAIVIAIVGVGLQIVIAGTVPLVALVLAFSFGFYGLLRKTAAVNATVGLLVEVMLLGPVAVAFMVERHLVGAMVFGSGSYTIDWLLISAGLVTAIPLMCFNSAARILPLSTLGFLQYLAPSGHFLLAVMAFGEPMTLARGVSFLCIWIALGLFSWDRSRGSRNRHGEMELEQEIQEYRE